MPKTKSIEHHLNPLKTHWKSPEIIENHLTSLKTRKQNKKTQQRRQRTATTKTKQKGDFHITIFDFLKAIFEPIQRHLLRRRISDPAKMK